MPLESRLFTQPVDQRLNACLEKDAAHITPGTVGDHVKRIQTALTLLSQGSGQRSVFLKPDGIYGPLTAAAVKDYRTQRRIFSPGEHQAGNIVGRRTIESLDREMKEWERQNQTSKFVSLTPAGAPHDHSKCPRLEAGDHERTPINPLGFGRKINLYGDHETDYLGFSDYAIDPHYAEGRPLTWQWGPRRIPDRSASDICMRSIPVYTAEEVRRQGKTCPSIVDEIRRIAMPGCRITFAGNEVYARKLWYFGPLIEKVDIVEPVMVDGQKIGDKVSSAWVWTLLG